MRWDLFCRVIDNHGDLGVCWRLARGLAAAGHQVRLWVDEPSALAWMAPEGAADGPGATGANGAAVITVRHWHGAASRGQAEGQAGDQASNASPGDVVVEAFGCDPPAAFVARMAARPRPPVWLNLEYLSAEPYAARSHGLASPQWHGPGAGLTKWFFYPGFGPNTGGLLHGDLADVDPLPDPATAALPAATPPNTPPNTPPTRRQVLLFCYDNPQLPGLLRALAAQGPTDLWVPPGPAQASLARLPLPAGLRWRPQPLLTQPSFDALLAQMDLNIVRGEDSFVRAQLASQSPWLWQIYPQQDGAHAAKLEAFLALYLADAPATLAGPLGQAFHAFNGLAPWPARLPPAADWAAHQRRWRAQLRAQTSLLGRLLRFVDDQRHGAAGPS